MSVLKAGQQVMARDPKRPDDVHRRATVVTEASRDAHSTVSVKFFGYVTVHQLPWSDITQSATRRVIPTMPAPKVINISSDDDDDGGDDDKPPTSPHTPQPKQSPPLPQTPPRASRSSPNDPSADWDSLPQHRQNDSPTYHQHVHFHISNRDNPPNDHPRHDRNHFPHPPYRKQQHPRDHFPDPHRYDTGDRDRDPFYNRYSGRNRDPCDDRSARDDYHRREDPHRYDDRNFAHDRYDDRHRRDDRDRTAPPDRYSRRSTSPPRHYPSHASLHVPYPPHPYDHSLRHPSSSGLRAPSKADITASSNSPNSKRPPHSYPHPIPASPPRPLTPSSRDRRHPPQPPPNPSQPPRPVQNRDPNANLKQPRPRPQARAPFRSRAVEPQVSDDRQNFKDLRVPRKKAFTARPRSPPPKRQKCISIDDCPPAPTLSPHTAPRRTSSRSASKTAPKRRVSPPRAESHDQNSQPSPVDVIVDAVIAPGYDDENPFKNIDRDPDVDIDAGIHVDDFDFNMDSLDAMASLNISNDDRKPTELFTSKRTHKSKPVKRAVPAADNADVKPSHDRTNAFALRHRRKHVRRSRRKEIERQSKESLVEKDKKDSDTEHGELFIKSFDQAVDMDDDVVVVEDEDEDDKPEHMAIRVHACVCQRTKEPDSSVRGRRGSVQCGMCGLWTHLRCAQFSAEELGLLQSGSRRFLCWKCVEEKEARGVYGKDKEESDGVSWEVALKQLLPKEDERGGEGRRRRRGIGVRQRLSEAEVRARMENVEALRQGVVRESAGAMERKLVEGVLGRVVK